MLWLTDFESFEKGSPAGSLAFLIPPPRFSAAHERNINKHTAGFGLIIPDHHHQNGFPGPKPAYRYCTPR